MDSEVVLKQSGDTNPLQLIVSILFWCFDIMENCTDEWKSLFKSVKLEVHFYFWKYLKWCKWNVFPWTSTSALSVSCSAWRGREGGERSLLPVGPGLSRCFQWSMQGQVAARRWANQWSCYHGNRLQFTKSEGTGIRYIILFSAGVCMLVISCFYLFIYVCVCVFVHASV